MEWTTEILRQQLLSLAEPAYQQFSAALIPGCDNLLGVRLPALRRLAAEIARSDWRAFLDGQEMAWQEEIMVRGMVIGKAKMPLSERLERISGFVPLIQNWSVCDSFCVSLTAAKKEQAAFYEFLQPFFQSKDVYAVRFGVVMLLDWFINDAYIDRVLSLLGNVRHSDYYVVMAVGWAISVAFISYPEKTLALLAQDTLDSEVRRKAIQKIRESKRVSPADKEMLRQRFGGQQR